jgi:hypothetical protein
MSQKRACKWVYALFVLLLIVMIVAPSMSVVYGQTGNLTPRRRNPFGKGLLYQWEVIVYQAPAPSIKSLATANFTIVGVMFAPCFSTFCAKPIANWLKEAKAAGLQTYTMIGNSYAKSVTWIPILVGLNIDYLDIDEPLSKGWTISQLQSFISSVLALKPKLKFIVNECSICTNNPISQLYALEMPNVFVAEDDYCTKSTIDYNIQLAQQYGKPAIAYAIFVPGSQDFDCYTNFASWVAYAKQLDANVFYYYVDSQGYWQQNWPIIAS